MSTDATTSTAVPPHLPDDPTVLQSMIRELLEKLHHSEHKNEQLQHQLDQLTRRLFGPRAERFDPNQPVLFAELTALPPPPEPPAAEPISTRKQKKKHGRRKLPDDLPRQRREYQVPEAELPCPDCGTRRVVFGQEVSEQLDYWPASLFVIEHVRFKYACPCCQGQVVAAPKPSQPIAKGVPGSGLLAHIIASMPITCHCTARNASWRDRASTCAARPPAVGWPPVPNCCGHSMNA
jgi:transposase